MTGGRRRREKNTSLRSSCRQFGAYGLVVWFALGVVACSVKEVPAGALIVDRVDILGADKANGDEAAARLATSETQHALAGLLQAIPILSYIDALTVEYRTYDPLVLDRDLERVRRWYRARGFYDAEVRAGRVVKTEEGHVRIEIVVNEGEPVLIEQAELKFEEWQQAMRANALLVDRVAKFRSEPIEAPETYPRFDEERYDAFKAGLRRTLTDGGYAYATVEGKVEVDVAKHTARVQVEAVAGPFCYVDKVTFEGLGEIPEEPIRRALGIEEGDAFSTEKIENAQYALADFQVFGSIEIVPQLSKKGEPQRTQVPIVVRVQPSALRGFEVGGGGELGTRVDVHATVGWQDRNFVGGLRTLAVKLRPSLLFYPLTVTTLFDGNPVKVLPQAELDVDFTQPGFPEARTNTLLSAGARFHRPRTLPLEAMPDVEQVVMYREADGSAGVERTFRFPYLGGFSFYANPAVKVRFDNPLIFLGSKPLPPGYANVLIPRLEIESRLDFRRNRQGKPDAVNPALGALISLNAQAAAVGDVDDIRLRPEIRIYAPIGQQSVFAVRWATGFLFPLNGYDKPLLDGVVDDNVARGRAQQLLSFRAFYSGGPNSNRGYNIGAVGPSEALNFNSQDVALGQLAPSGGLGMWELSTEVRFPLDASWFGVVFVDASDVVRAISDFRFTYPHISPGIGVRYVSQVGSIRLDVGFRPPYLQKIGSAQLEESEGGPAAGTSAGIPLAFHLAIGEAI